MRDRFWLEEIIDECGKAQRFAADDDERSFYAVLKATENVWEAAKALSPAMQEQLLGDDLSALKRTRDFYAHQYHRIDPQVARRTAQKDLPRLAARARDLLGSTPAADGHP